MSRSLLALCLAQVVVAGLDVARDTGLAMIHARATGTASLSSTGGTASTTSSPGTATGELGCVAFSSLLSSCDSATPGFVTLSESVAASCVCYDHDAYTTVFDDYVSACAAWAKTASPADYSGYSILSTFCEDYSPKTTKTSSQTTSARSTTSTSSESISASSTVTVAPTSSTKNAAPNLVDERASWIMNILTLVLSFFFLI